MKAIGSFLSSAILLLFLTGLTAGHTGCAKSPSESGDSEAQRLERLERIATLQLAIDDDHSTLENLLTRVYPDGTAELYEDPRIAGLAHRLAHNRVELETLERAASRETDTH